MEQPAEYALEARVYRLESQVDQLEAQLYRLRMARLNTWILVIYFVISAALYGALARGFGWI